jgi:histidinol phosphatase-like PHP family hydrolase
MKIDLHVHTKERSYCGRSTEEEQVRAAIDAGLDAIVFTDHNRLAPPARLQELNTKYAPFQIFGGIEVSITSEHILVLGVHDDALEHHHWSYPELHSFVRKHNGFIAVAHPFRFNPNIGLDLKRFPPDAIEAYSNNISRHTEPRLLSFARHLSVPVLSNSDGHYIDVLGHYYNILERTPADERELIMILRSGQFTCVSPEWYR